MKYKYSFCSSLVSITIPNSVTTIGENTFRGCSSLASLTIGKSVTSIGDYAFYDCRSLALVTMNCPIVQLWFEENKSIKEVVLGDDVASITGYAFKDCNNLNSVTIGNNVTSIRERTFYGCSSLASVTIGNSVASIDRWAFYGCSSLISVTSLNPTPPAFPRYTTPFDMIVYETATLNIPEGSINLYKNTPGWSPFFNINGVTSLPPCKLDKQNQADDWIYTLKGERIDSSNGSFLNKGIYIKNGKKVVIK